jgi:hypothetical protein
MTLLAGTIVENGMKLHAEVDANIKVIILNALSEFLDQIFSTHDLTIGAKKSTFSLTANDETVAMPTDLLRVDSFSYDVPYQGFTPTELSATMYNRLQSLYINTQGSPPYHYWPDYQNRVFRFTPTTTQNLTGVIMYYPQFIAITVDTDLQFFPLTRLLQLFCYLTYVDYLRNDPVQRYLAEYSALYVQLTTKYSSIAEVPRKDGAYYKSPEIAMP